MGKIILWILAVLLGLCILYILFLLFCALLVNEKLEYQQNSPFYRFLLYSATAFCVKLLRIHIHTEGIDKIPKDGRFLFVSNHRSNFDPILTWYVLKDYDLAFISKAENFRIPIFGRIIRKCCFMAIDRENPRNAIKTIEKAAGLIEKDEVSVAVYPEGTRSKECVLLSFHNGVFKIAQKANVPIVVAAIQGTEQIHKNYLRRRSDIQFEIVDMIPSDYVKMNRTTAISDRVRLDLSKVLTEK